MAFCVVVIPAGTQFGTAGPNQALGPYNMLALSPNTGPCASGEYYLYTKGEVDALAIGGSASTVQLSAGWLTDLTPTEGGQIAGAVLVIWAIAYACRMLIKALNIDGDSSTSKESET